MSRETKDKFHKVRRIFTTGLLLVTLYSKTSIAVENLLENRYSSSIVATQIIYILSQFFPVLHSLLENMLPKHINDNQQLLYSFGGFQGGISSSPGWSSVGGKYKNSQFSLHDLKHRLISFSPSLSSSYLKSSVFVGPLEPKFQNIDSNLSRNETLIPNLGHFYSTIRDFLPSHEKRRENFILENITVIKQGFSYVSNETQETKSKVSFSSYDNMFTTSKNLSSNLLTKTKKTKQGLSFDSINYQFKEPENFKVKPKNEHVNELPIKSIVEEVQEHHLENRTEETVYVKAQSETTFRVDTLAEVSKMSELQPEERQENQYEKRSEQKVALNLDITQEPFLEKEITETVKKSSPAKPFKNAAAPWAANLSPERKRLSPLPSKTPKKQLLAPRQLPFKLEFESAEKKSRIEGSTLPPPSMVRLHSQSQPRNDKSSINYVKELDLALQEGGLKFSKDSGVLLALQKFVKDEKLKVDGIRALVAKLSGKVNELIEKAYKVTIEKFEDHILRLIKPRHKIKTIVNFKQGFKQLSGSVLELWRTKLLTDYIETSIFKERSLPKVEEVTLMVDKVVMQSFEQKLDSAELGVKLKQNAIINIKSTFQKSLLYWNPNNLSDKEKNQQKKEILAQLFKLLVLDPKFQVQTKKKKDKNETIVVNISKLQGATYPLIIQAVHQLYGYSYVFNLQKNILREYVKIHHIFEGLESFSENERDKIFASVLQELQELREREAKKEQEEQNKQEQVKKPESQKFYLFSIIQHENNDLLKKLIIQSVEKIWDSSLALALGLKSVQLSNEVSGNSCSALLGSFSPEEIVKQSDSWLTDRLLGLLPGSSQEEKLEFWFNIAEQDRILADIRSKMNKTKPEIKDKGLKEKEEEVFKRTYAGIMKSIFTELGSQKFSDFELKSQPTLYRDVKCLIEDYLNPNTGFPDIIERTEQELRQSLRKGIKSLKTYKLISSITETKKYVIRARASGSKSYDETPPLEVPKFISLFTLPYWWTMKERLIKRAESDKVLQEKKRLKKLILLEKLNELFFEKKVKDLSEPLHKLNEEEKENFPKKPLQKSSPKKPLQSIPQSGLSSVAPPPPPIPQKFASANNTKVGGIDILQRDIQNSLKKIGLNVRETSPSLELLLRYKLQNRSLESSAIAKQFYIQLKGIFCQTLCIVAPEKTQEKVASIFGVKQPESGVKQSENLIFTLSQKLNTELPNYLLESITIEDIDPNSPSGVKIDFLAKKMNSKIIQITTDFVKLHFKEAFEKHGLRIELMEKDFETLSLFVKNKLSKSYPSYTEDEKLELVLGAFIRILDHAKHNKDFTFPKKEAKKDKDQLILNVEEFKSTIIHLLNEVIAQKFNGSRPFIKVPTCKEKIEPSEVLPLLGKSFLQSAFTILPGSDEKEKVSLLIKYNSDQIKSFIEDVLNLRTNYDYKTTENQDKSIVLTRYTTKIFKEVIIERYKGFSKALLSSQRAMILRSVDSYSLLLALLNNQLGDKPTTHTLSMSSPHDRKTKIEKKETISAFDILLSLPKIWKNKQKIEEKRKREVEEQRLKELTMTRRVQTLQKFIQSELEIQS